MSRLPPGYATMSQPAQVPRSYHTSAEANRVPSYAAAVANNSVSPALGRARLSCLPCRKRKSKCDEGVPCTSCLLRGTADVCQLPEPSTATSRRPADKPITVAPSATESLRANPAVPPLLTSTEAVDSTSLTSLKRKRRAAEPESSRSYDSAGRSGDEALQELRALRDGIGRLEDLLASRGGSSNGASPISAGDAFSRANIGDTGEPAYATPSMPVRTHPNPLPARDDETMDELCSIYPCQRDCEVLLEYLVQEADWLSICASYQWLQPIWSRFIYGGRISKVEAVFLTSSLALAALLLAEAPHAYYSINDNPSTVTETLIAWVFAYLRAEQDTVGTEDTYRLPGQWKSKDHVLSQCLGLGITLEYLRSAGQSKQHSWPLVTRAMQRLCERVGLMNEGNQIWDTFDEYETEMARRFVWHLVTCERWSSIFADAAQLRSLAFRESEVRRPTWMRTSATVPLHASPAGLPCNAKTTRLPTASKSRPRLFRSKTSSEVASSMEVADMIVSLSDLLPPVADYISAVKRWKQSFQDKASSHSPETTAGSGPDHRRESLLHQGVSLVEDLKSWRAGLGEYSDEMKYWPLSSDDYEACRKATAASMVLNGVRQMLNAVTRGWVTEELFADVSSPLLVKLQQEAIHNAKDSVRTIDMTRALYSCGKIVYFSCWCAYIFFSAATTLAIPLLGASRLAEESAQAQERFGLLVLRDRYTLTAGSRPTPGSDGVSPNGGAQATPSPATPSKTNGSTVAALTLSELRTLAPDILRILDLLPLLNASPLGKEAMGRLRTLVDNYGIGGSANTAPAPSHFGARDWGFSPVGAATVDEAATALATLSKQGTTPGARREPGHGSGVHGQPMLPFDFIPNVSAEPEVGTIDAANGHDAPAISNFWDSQGLAVLDSLVALDDLWWERILSS
ncbi:unnamed protein product [Parajaminaea phylloscopi]